MPPAAPIIGHLAQALPAREADAEVSLAIAAWRSQMIPGLASQAQGIYNGQRERLMQQIDKDLNNTCCMSIGIWSDPESWKSSPPLPSRRRARRITRLPLRLFAQGFAVGQEHFQA